MNVSVILTYCVRSIYQHAYLHILMEAFILCLDTGENSIMARR